MLQDDNIFTSMNNMFVDDLFKDLDPNINAQYIDDDGVEIDDETFKKYLQLAQEVYDSLRAK